MTTSPLQMPLARYHNSFFLSFPFPLPSSLGLFFSLCSFFAHSDLLQVEKYAKELGVLVWSNPQKQYLMVTEKGHELIRPFIKKNIS